MKTWLISISVAVIITSITSLILPEGKLKAFVKSSFSLIVMLVILQPMLNMSLDKIKVDDVFSMNKIELQYEYLCYVAQEKIDAYENACLDLIEKFGIKGASVTIKYYMTENGEVVIEKVKIFLYDAVIISNEEHIDIIEGVKNEIATYLGINNDFVVIYERCR